MGTPALTTLGMKEKEMKLIANWIHALLENTKPAPAEKGEGLSRAKVEIEPHILNQVKEDVAALLKTFPLYPELDID